MDSADIELDFDANFEPQIRARSNTWPLRPSRELEPQSSPVTGDDSSTGVDQQSGAKDPLGLGNKKIGSRRNAWGNLSYADLITKAIQNSPEKRLTLSQIYDWMVQNVPYFKDKGDSTSSAGWKNSIRHNLSLHSRFMRIQNEGTGKSSWWVLNPDAKPGKTPRRRAGSMETKSYEKKRGRIRKKVEALRAGLENGTLSPGGSEDYLDGLNFGDFRPRASSSASTCSRLSPISAVAEPDLTSSDIQSSLPWGSDVSNSPTIYTDNVYSDLVESLVEGMKLSSQDGLKMDMVTGMNGQYISDASNDYSSQASSYGNVSQSSPGLDNQYNPHPAQLSYPKQQQQQQQQMNGLDFRTQNFNNSLQIQIGQSPVNNSSSFSPTNLYGDDFSDSILGIKQEIETLSPVHMTTPSHGSMASITHQSNCQDQTSPTSGPFTPHHSPRPQAGLGNGLNLHGCQISPQQNRHLIQQQTIAAATLQQQQQQALQQATRDSILREALTRSPSSYRPHAGSNTPSSNFSPLLNHTPLACAAAAAATTTMSNGLNGIGLAMRPNSSPHHQALSANQIHSMGERFTENHIITNNNVGCGNIGNGVPLDIDVDLMGISALDYDMEQVIKQELSLEGSLDFNFDAGPVTSVGQNVVH